MWRQSLRRRRRDVARPAEHYGASAPALTLAHGQPASRGRENEPRGARLRELEPGEDRPMNHPTMTMAPATPAAGRVSTAACGPLGQPSHRLRPTAPSTITLGAFVRMVNATVDLISPTAG